jgi:hypothetical protein
MIIFVKINSMNELFELTSTLRKQVELCRTGKNDKQVFDAVQTINRIDSTFLTMPAKPVVKSFACDDCTAYPFDERGETPLCSTCKDNPKKTVL